MAGAAPTFEEAAAGLVGCIKWLEKVKDAGSVDATNLADIKDAHTQLLEGEFAPQAAVAMRSLEAQVGTAIEPARVRQLLDPWMLELGRAIGKPTASAQLIAEKYLPRYLHDNAYKVVNRDVTYGTPTVDGGNTGDFEIYALRVNEDNYNLEGVYAEAYRAEIDKDATEGLQRNRERLLIEGAPKWPNGLQRTGSGTSRSLALRDALNSIIPNAGFDSFSGDAATPDAIQGWVKGSDGLSTLAGDGTDLVFDDTNIYMPKPKASSIRHSVQFHSTLTLERRLDIRNTPMIRPLFGQIASNKTLGTAVGSFTLSAGALTTGAITAASLGADWVTTRLPLTSSAWPKNLFADPLKVSLAVTMTSGYWNFDDLVLVFFDEVAGQYLVAVGGATAAQKGDFATWTNSLVGAINQYWIWVGYGVTWPHGAVASPSQLGDP